MKELEAIVILSLKMRLPRPVELVGATVLSAALLSSRNFTAGIGTMLQLPAPGCRGFIGPVPPPLWIEVPLWGYLVDNSLSQKACRAKAQKRACHAKAQKIFSRKDAKELKK